jgi:hypothetical protein
MDAREVNLSEVAEASGINLSTLARLREVAAKRQRDEDAEMLLAGTTTGLGQ